MPRKNRNGSKRIIPLKNERYPPFAEPKPKPEFKPDIEPEETPDIKPYKEPVNLHGGYRNTWIERKGTG